MALECQVDATLHLNDSMIDEVVFSLVHGTDEWVAMVCICNKLGMGVYPNPVSGYQQDIRSFWRLFNHIWYSILHIKWRLDGLANKIEANQQTDGYHQSAQIMPGIKSKLIPKLSGRGMVTTSVKNLLLKSKHFVVLSSFLMWGSLVQVYRNQLNEEYSLDIPAIKYEHFISNPKASTEAMFKHVGLPADLVPLAIHGMLEDSQKDTIVSRRNMSQCASIGDPKGELAQELLVLCDMFGLDSYTDMDLPNTITSL
ncbi:hypothetical protein CAPTEDRAFT_189090 [Capitella teleta]|uniref:Sulfotransferase domain-containing protein n=1 Tax=Capitella teleta TaxID=283909 RepID=R7T3L5_CAPTE|nr:hypothetical protein CAPTEDRAFT_189090 [Capitella teleta]|eukprot:ELT87298.1 hypothetical protein CAPTEDRAFT_189090 [Capitella teleta]